MWNAFTWKAEDYLTLTLIPTKKETLLNGHNHFARFGKDTQNFRTYVYFNKGVDELEQEV